MKRVASRTRLSEGWEPSVAELLFASELGVDGVTEAPRFLDYHLAHGSLMASWPAAWRTWCRNAAKFSGTKKASPLIDKADPYGAITWGHQQRDATTMLVWGASQLCIGGQDAIRTAVEICEAAGLSPDTRPDLGPVGDWLRAEIDPDLIIEAIRTATSRPDRPNLRYYSKRVLEKAGRTS